MIAGVNVYVFVILALKAGDQVPVTYSCEVVSNGLALPAQIGAIAAKVGVTRGWLIVMILLAASTVQLSKGDEILRN